MGIVLNSVGGGTVDKVGLGWVFLKFNLSKTVRVFLAFLRFLIYLDGVLKDSSIYRFYAFLLFGLSFPAFSFLLFVTSTKSSLTRFSAQLKIAKCSSKSNSGDSGGSLLVRFKMYHSFCFNAKLSSSISYLWNEYG